jgi:hypothetical protein
MTRIFIIAIAIHTAVQFVLGIALNQQVQSYVAMVALPAMFAVAGIFSYVVCAAYETVENLLN